jgi:hypothetical protein
MKWVSLIILFFSGIFYSLGNLKTIRNFYIDDTELHALFISHDVHNNKLIMSQRKELMRSIETVQGFNQRKDQIYITEVGFILILVYCIISGFSGVYNEYLLKLNFTDSIYVQNIYLYSYGCALNYMAYVVHFKTSVGETSITSTTFFANFFTGFSVYTWIIIVTQVFNGFLMSVVMKHASNITRLFVISCSLIVTTLLSVVLFSLKLNIYYYYSFSAMVVALYLYIFK